MLQKDEDLEEEAYNIYLRCQRIKKLVQKKVAELDKSGHKKGQVVLVGHGMVFYMMFDKFIDPC